MAVRASNPFKSNSRSWLILAAIAAVIACAPCASAATTSVDTVTVFATAPTAYELGTKPGVFTVTRTGITGALTVNYTLTGTATFASDYTVSGGTAVAGAPVTGSVVIPDGGSSALVIIAPINDAAIEGAETVDLTIQTNAAYIVGPAFVGEVTIADDDLTASIEIPRVVCTEPFKQAGPQPTVDEFGAAVVRAQMNAVFSGGALGEITVDFGGTASVDLDYHLSFVVGSDSGFSIGSMKDAGRRSLNSSVIDGTQPVLDANFNKIAFTGNAFTVTAGISRSGPGIFRVGDWIALAGQSSIFTVISATPSGGNYDIVVSPALAPNTQLPIQSEVETAIRLPVANRWQIGGLQGYDHVEFEYAPANDALVEGAESVTCSLEASPDFTLKDPTVGTAYIADTTNVLSAALVSNAVEGSTPGAIRINASSPFPFAVNIPFVVSGTANYNTDLPNVGAPADYTMTGLDITNGVGLVTLPAGQLGVSIIVTPINDGIVETIESVTVTLVSSLDYALAGSGSSSLNPSATLNIADPTVVVTTTGTSTTGTAATGSSTTGTATTTGGTTGVRPLPTSSNGSSCGLGSGLGVLGLIGLAIIGIRRRAA